MNALAPYIAALHQQDLLEEAELRRRVKLVRGSQPRVPAWRRGLGGLFATAARSLDPCLEVVQSTSGQADGRGARAIAV